MDKAEQSVKEATREDVKAAMQWVAMNTNRVPTLVGPTASGKTVMVHQWAEEIGAEDITVLLSQHTPDEVAGFQTEVGGVLVPQFPHWWTQAQRALDAGKPVVLLFDELGLAREEVRGAVYTFFRDRTLHSRRLDGGNVYVVAAMNPATLAPPFMSRAVMMHVPADRSYLLSFATHPMAIRAAEGGNLTVNEDSAYTNDAPPFPVTVDASAVDALNQLNKGGFWQMTEPAQRTVLQGLVPAATLQELLRDRLDASKLARHPELVEETLDGMNAIDALAIIESLLESLPQLDPKERALLLAAIQDTLYNDIDNLLEPYMAVERPEHIQKAVLELDNDAFWEEVKRRKFVEAKNGELSGTAIRRWIEQRGETS